MMLPPDETTLAYAVERGTCPRCGSGDVGHLVVGLLSEPPDPEAQHWLVFVGCCYPGYDRDCQACGLRWTTGDLPAEETR